MLSQRPKELPPPPLALRTKRALANSDEYSPETYAKLLEQENEQLRLRTQQLSNQVKTLEENLSIQRRHGMASLEKVERYKLELRQRDNTVAEMANTIIHAFQQYKTQVSDPEGASAQSQFDDSGSEDFVISLVKL
ncbi:hypothetical protein V8F06_013886 [Rhypophila decipiens]